MKKCIAGMLAFLASVAHFVWVLGAQAPCTDKGAILLAGGLIAVSGIMVAAFAVAANTEE